MKKPAVVYRSNKLIPVTFEKSPEEMSHEELMSELVSRVLNEKTQVMDFREQSELVHEIEKHQLELEIQNRELVEKYRDIEELNKKYVNLFDLAPVGYFSLDTKGNIVDLNLTAAKILGFEKKKIAGKNLGKWILNEDIQKFLLHLVECSFSGKKAVCEIELQNYTGERFPIELHSISVPDSTSEKPLIKSAMIDLTERQKLRAAVEESKFLREERELREKFISTLSHDIRTPLTSSKLCAQMLNGAICDIEKKKKLYELMVEELDRADRMIRELLDASRINGGESLPLMFKKCDLNSLAQKCIDNISSLYSGKIQVNLRSEGSMIGNWSRDGLHRVLENLLSNAIKYGTENLPITISLEDKGDSVSVIVHNYGNPIPQKEQKKIFDAFHRTDAARSSDSTGWGLGLSLVSSIIQRHQGSIVVRSLSEEGTSFIVSLPKKPQ